MAERSVGCVVVRDGEILLIHSSGWYNRGKPFSIPKGLVDDGEDDTGAALREVEEETGLACRILGDLGSIRQRGGKEVRAFLAEVVSGRIFPDGTCPDHDWEVDKARFFTPGEAKERILEAQRPLLERALEQLGMGGKNDRRIS